MDGYWQNVWLEFQEGNLIVTQEQLEYFKETHPIAKALAESDCNPFDPQIQAMIAASQGTSNWIDPSEVITPRRHEEIESPVSIQRQQPVNESPISIQGRTNEVESPINIQRQRTTPESQLAVTQTVTQAEPETPVSGSSPGPAGSNSLEVWYPCSECLAVLTSASSLRFHIMTKH